MCNQELPTYSKTTNGRDNDGDDKSRSTGTMRYKRSEDEARPNSESKFDSSGSPIELPTYSKTTNGRDNNGDEKSRSTGTKQYKRSEDEARPNSELQFDFSGSQFPVFLVY